MFSNVFQIFLLPAPPLYILVLLPQSYPDAWQMYTVGSAFYALYFIVSFHMFPHIDTPGPWTLWRTSEHSLAASMLVMLVMDAYRLSIGPAGTRGPPPSS